MRATLHVTGWFVYTTRIVCSQGSVRYFDCLLLQPLARHGNAACEEIIDIDGHLYGWAKHTGELILHISYR